jgi:hypothetical protein
MNREGRFDDFIDFSDYSHKKECKEIKNAGANKECAVKVPCYTDVNDFSGDSLLTRLSRVAANPFKHWQYSTWKTAPTPKTPIVTNGTTTV